MQIRELDLKELQSVYEVVSQLYTELSYKEFEDLIYDMRHMEYKMLGIIDSDELIAYAGVSIQTNLYHKRHLHIFELVTDEKHRRSGYAKMLLEYIVDYAKIGMCEKIVSSQFRQNNEIQKLYEINGFVNIGSICVKNI